MNAGPPLRFDWWQSPLLQPEVAEKGVVISGFVKSCAFLFCMSIKAFGELWFILFREREITTCNKQQQNDEQTIAKRWSYFLCFDK
jgi:hypothetical protein